MKEKRKNKVVSKHRQERTHSLGLILSFLVEQLMCHHHGSDMNEEWWCECIATCISISKTTQH